MDKGSISGKRIYEWHRLMKTAFGWSPSVDFLPAIPAAIALYISLYFIGLVLYHFTNIIVRKSFRSYVHDYIKTLIIVAYPFGHGIMRTYYGQTGYMCGMVPMVFLTVLTLKEGDGNPIEVWWQYFMRIIPLWKCLLKNVIQIAGGISAYHLGMYIMRLELHPTYVDRLKNYNNQFCDTHLSVSEYCGFLIECGAVVYANWFSCKSFTRFPAFDLLLNIFNIGVTVGQGVHLTGLYLNPAMASGHTWGCGDTSKLDHVAIYWVGPMLGTWISVQIFIAKTPTETKTSGTQTETPKSGTQTETPRSGTQDEAIKLGNDAKRSRRSRKETCE